MIERLHVGGPTKEDFLTIPAAVVFNPLLKPSDVRVYLAVYWFVRAGLERPSQTAISELAGVNRNTTMTSLGRLEAAGILEVDASASPHAYRLAA